LNFLRRLEISIFGDHMKDGMVVAKDGTKRWYSDGRLHRENGPAVMYIDGTNVWYYHGEIHRDNGPAMEHLNGTKCWYIRGQLHREDGPAMEFLNGSGFWYYHNRRVDCASQKEFERLIKVKAFW
jgi:hypothetical protein